MKICIDAGHNHSGYDTGAMYNGLKEQDITFKIAEILKNKLVLNNFVAVMTRKSITENLGTNLKSSINRRVDISNSNNCDLFVSIHCNAGGGTGVETLIYGKGGKAEMLAENIQNRICTNLNIRNRGVKARTDLGVLRYTNCPAVLVETAFIDNINDANLLKNNIEDFAQSIYEGICNFAKVPTINEKHYLESANDIIWELSQIIDIEDVDGAVSALEKAKDEDSSLYWILYKIVNKEL